MANKSRREQTLARITGSLNVAETATWRSSPDAYLCGQVPTEKQKEVFDALDSGRYTYFGLGGAVGSAKTWALPRVWLKHALMYPGHEAWVGRAERLALNEHTMPMFKSCLEWLKREHGLSYSWQGADHKITLHTHEDPMRHSVLRLLALDDETRYQGGQADMILIDEATHTTEAAWSMLATRLRGSVGFIGREVEPPLVLFWVSNPGTNWCRREFYTPAEQGYLGDGALPLLAVERKKAKPDPKRVGQLLRWSKSYFLQMYIRDNPYLPKDYYITSLAAATDEQGRKNVEGDWSKSEGQVYKSFDQARHVRYFEPKELTGKELGDIEWMASYDWARAHNSAALAAFIHWEMRQVEGVVCRVPVLHIYDELVITTNELSQYGNWLQQWGCVVWADPTLSQQGRNAGADIPAEFQQVYEVTMLRADQTSGIRAKQGGIAVVGALLDRDQIVIHGNNCVELIRSLEEYSFAEDSKSGGGHSGTKTAPDFEDAADALRYLAINAHSQLAGHDAPVRGGVNAGAGQDANDAMPSPEEYLMPSWDHKNAIQRRSHTRLFNGAR